MVCVCVCVLHIAQASEEEAGFFPFISFSAAYPLIALESVLLTVDGEVQLHLIGEGGGSTHLAVLRRLAKVPLSTVAR